jgi:predicted dehydrogenase
MKAPVDPAPSGLTRRRFLQSSAALTSLPLLSSLTPVFAASNQDRLRIGLVGCGGRGMGALRDCLAADPSVQVRAIGDIFPDRVDAAYKQIKQGRPEGNNPLAPVAASQMDLTPERCFSGFDAYKGVIHAGIDLVLLVTPPGFRPLHLQAALDANLHVFMEKPVAVDVAGVRKMIELAKVAEAKKRSVVAGTQRRHAENYLEAMKRIHDGAIGELVGGQCYWLQQGLWHRGRQAEWTEMEYQIHNWLYFTWLSGDHIVEQHIHNLDVMNWAFGGPPVKALGMGGRQSRTDPKYGDAFDHFAIEYEYANGARVQSFCRQVQGASSRVSERIVGTKGWSDPAKGIEGANAWSYAGEAPNSFRQEHVDLVRSIREGRPINQTQRIAESTLTAIMGRVSAYTGREVSFNWLLNASKLDLTPAAHAFGDAPAVSVPIPGETPLV